MNNPLISICIPAYKRLEHLKVLLDSIHIQTYRNFEVVITDDSPDESVFDLVNSYKDKFLTIYVRNQPALGTPENWNAAIQLACGEWIKLMHDDDWFEGPDSLAEFVRHIVPGRPFVFSAYQNVYIETSKHKTIHLRREGLLRKLPGIVMLENLIGPPSVTFIHRTVNQQYDKRLKWRVDTDLYASILKYHAFVYIDKPLVNIGISNSQVTQSCINNPEVELPEAMILIEKHGLSSIRHIRVYDAWWRLFRNMRILSHEKLNAYTKHEWPEIIQQIVKDIAAAPEKIFGSGIFSKWYMSQSFYRNRDKLPK